MSRLRLTCPYVGVIDLVIQSMQAPLYGDIRTSQTKTARHHQPIKAGQQALTLRAQFPGPQSFAAMQDFARKHQFRAPSTVQNPERTLNWPERNIDNWSGILKRFNAGADRFTPTPTAQLEFLLVDSMVSQKTWTSSFGEDFNKFFETDIGDPILIPPPPTTVPKPGDPGFIGPVVTPPTTTGPRRPSGGNF